MFIRTKVISFSRQYPARITSSTIILEVEASSEWLDMVEEQIKCLGREKNLSKDFIDELFIATMEGYENVYRHSKKNPNSGKSILKIHTTDRYVELVFTNEGIFYSPKRPRTAEELRRNVRNYKDTRRSFGAGQLAIERLTDVHPKAQQVGNTVITSFIKYFQPEHDLAYAVGQ